MEFDWDDANRKHIARHDVTSDEAEQVILGWHRDLSIEEHETDGVRVRSIGESVSGRVLVVVTTWRGQRLRVVSCWDAPRALKLDYLHAKVGRYDDIS